MQLKPWDQLHNDRSVEPFITVGLNYLYINTAAYQRLGRPKALRIAIDRKGHRLRLELADPKEPGSYRVSMSHNCTAKTGLEPGRYVLPEDDDGVDDIFVRSGEAL